MSAGQDNGVAQTAREAIRRTGRTERYVVLDERAAFRFAYGGYIVVEAPDGHIVDRFRSALAAEYRAVQLNAGVARVDSHAVIGCRVVQS